MENIKKILKLLVIKVIKARVGNHIWTFPSILYNMSNAVQRQYE